MLGLYCVAQALRGIDTYVILNINVCPPLQLIVSLGNAALSHSTGRDIPGVRGRELSILCVAKAEVGSPGRWDAGAATGTGVACQK